MNNEKIQFHWDSEVIEVKGDSKNAASNIKKFKNK